MFAGELSAEAAACIVGAICGFGGFVIGLFVGFKIIRDLDRIVDETAKELERGIGKETGE